MSLQSSCTSQQTNQRFDATMACRERWTETTGTCHSLKEGRGRSSLFLCLSPSLFRLVCLAQSGMILKLWPCMFPLLSAREGHHSYGARSGKLRYPSKASGNTEVPLRAVAATANANQDPGGVAAGLLSVSS